MGEAAQHFGTTPARVWLRRTVATLAGAFVLTGTVQLPAASAAPAAAPTGSRAATVNLNSVTPAVAPKSGTLKITGTVTNNGSGAITGAHVGVRLGDGIPLGSRSAIGNTASTGDFSPADGFEIPNHTVTLANIPSHGTLSFTLDMPIKALGLRGDGVYELGVTASGTTRDTGYEHVVGIKRTFLPSYGKGGDKATRSTFLWPLIDRPHVDIRTPGGDEQQAPLFRDDDLAAELAPGGRLEQMVALGKNLPVTWVIDPDLLATVDAMTKPYKVVGRDGDTTHTIDGTGSAYATQWLHRLHDAVQGRQVVALPFGDPDIASIAHAGRTVPGTIAHLKSATDLAATTLDTILQVTARTDFAWPDAGAVDPSIVNAATAGGADKIIARSDSFHETGLLNYTPTAARPIGGGTTAVVADSSLSNAFSGELTRAGATTLAVQRFLAQSLMIYEQAPETQRSILVAPQRMPTTSQARAMATAIATAVSGGWTQPIDLGAAAAQTPDPGANQTVPAARAYPAALRRQELSTEAFRQVQSVQDSLSRFLVILSRKDRVTTPFGNAVLRSMSTQWRGERHSARSFRDDIQTYLGDLTDDVHIINKQPITLSGRSATIPVTVENSLAQEVSGLELRLTSNQANRLDPGSAQPLDIGGGHNRSLKFPTTANANGRAWVTAQLYTRDGVPYGSAMVFQVYVTSITDTVMLVIAGGLLLLVLAGVRMYRQRKRLALRAAQEPDTDPEAAAKEEPRETEEPAGTEDETDQDETPATRRNATVPGQPGDPVPDTSTEDAGPPAPGEKVDR